MSEPTQAADVNAAVAAAVKEVGPQPGPLLEVLHAVQHRLGCVPEEAVAPNAKALNLSVTTPCGRITLEPVYCLGLCSQSPAALVGDDPQVHLTPQSVETLLAGLLATDTTGSAA